MNTYLKYIFVCYFCQGFKKQALAVSTDPEHRFELALALEDLNTAHELAKEANSQQKWRQLASLATQQGKLDLVRECLNNAEDHAGLLLLATCTGNADLVKEIGNYKVSNYFVEKNNNNYFFKKVVT